MALTVDQMLERIGSFQRFQWILLWAYGYAMITVSTFPKMIISFITAEPDWICVEGNNTLCNFTEPITLTSKHYRARCSMPREAWTFVKGFTSTVTEYDLVCDKSYLQSIAQSCFWAGMILGLIIGGYVTDRLGRRITYFAGAIGIVVPTWIMVFPEHFGVFIVCRTFVGVASGFINASGFVLMTEYTGKMHRAKIGIYSFYFWVAGQLIVAVIGYFLPNWRHFLLTTAALALPCLVICWFFPESVRWLLLNGKNDKAKNQLAKVAHVNQKPFPEDELKMPEGQVTGNFTHLFHNREATKRTLISWNIWFTVSLVYYGVSYGSVDLGWNRYLVFGLTALIEYPSNYAAIWSAGRFGRKKATGFGLVFACLASVITVSIPFEQSRKADASTICRIIMAVVAKFSINLSFSVIYVWTVELFPTSIRGMALSTASAAARAGSFSASYVIWLIRIHSLLPFGIMGLICFQSAILTVFLPETNGQPTMETMTDMIHKEDPFLSPIPEEPVVNDDKRTLSEMYLGNQV